jgi:S-(hydroxymethyl)glutathione dehydrogenase/alcohol dehydrogenase
MKIKAAVTQGNGEFSIETIVLSEPQANEVLVKIVAAGVCHTDYDSMNWDKSMIMGHEGAGHVLAVGPEVKSLKVGDPVAFNWSIPCGSCYQCEAGEESLCETNSFVTAKDPDKGQSCASSTLLNGKPISHSFNIGTMAEASLVKEEALVKINNDMPLTSAALMSCAVMTGFGSVMNVAKVEKGSSVVVLGCGGVGFNVIQGARIAGAKEIYAIDLSEDRLQMAKSFGATHLIKAEKDDKGLLKIAEQIKKLTGRGADYAFECTAIPELGAAPLAMVRNGGMAVQVSGIEEVVSIDMELFEWDKIYINPLYGKCCPQRDFPILMNHYSKGELLLDEMVSKTYKLEELAQAFKDMHDGKIAKGVLLFET